MDKIRRRRINRIKRVILVILALAVIIPTVICVILASVLGRTREQLASAREMLSDTREELEKCRQDLAVLSALSGLERKDEEGHSDDWSVDPGAGDQAEGLPDEALSAAADRDPAEKAGEAESGDPSNLITYDIYLTFDDGPSENTEEILSILRKYDVKASFFVNGREDEESLDLYREIARGGHTLGMHSYSHRYGEIYSSPDAFRSDLDRIRELLLRAADTESVYYRFPGGSSNHAATRSVMAGCIDVLGGEGIDYLDWNIDSGDGDGRDISAAEIVDNVFNNFGRYQINVVLLHDGAGHSETVKALPLIIERARNMGARLLPVGEEAVSVKHVFSRKQ